jgi:hypothetical protein
LDFLKGRWFRPAPFTHFSLQNLVPHNFKSASITAPSETLVMTPDNAQRLGVRQPSGAFGWGRPGTPISDSSRRKQMKADTSRRSLTKADEDQSPNKFRYLAASTIG